MNRKPIYSLVFLVSVIVSSSVLAADSPDKLVPVTDETFIRAEVDARMLRFQEAGGLNGGIVFRDVTPTDRAQQPVPRMNRDTIYKGIPIDTKDGFSITIPEYPEDRYVSVYLLDNDHYTIDILREPGTHKMEAQDTRYIIAIPRVQVLNPADEADVEIARQILAKVTADSGSKVTFEAPNWNWQQMLALRAEYEAKAREFSQYPPTFQDTRASGKTTPEHHRIAVASSWGLFPDYETVYINDEGPEGSLDGCYSATYDVPDNNAFWSITMYDSEGYIFSDDATLNASNTKINADGSFTAYYGSKKACGDVANRLDITDGWALLVRVYRPGESVSAGKYKMPEIEVVSAGK